MTTYWHRFIISQYLTFHKSQGLSRVLPSEAAGWLRWHLLKVFTEKTTCVLFYLPLLGTADTIKAEEHTRPIVACVCVCMCVPSPAFLWCVGVFGSCVAPPCWRKRAAPLTMKKLSLRLGWGWEESRGERSFSRLIFSYQGEIAGKTL